MEARVSVRSLVEFILRSGDIDNRGGGSSDQALQEGTRIHRMIQKRMGADYRSEVPLSFTYKGKDVDIKVEGRADGIIENESGVTVDEIKSTYAEIMHYQSAQPLHLAQARFYAYIYAKENALKTIKIRITYCNIDTEEIRYFHEEATFEELEKFVSEVCFAYEKWALLELEWKETRNESIKALAFPFDYRDGQEELVKQVYYTIHHKKKLFIEAPTGVGKTISTMYPAIQAMGQEKASKLFYLTAKTITRTVAAEALDIMRKKGLQCKGIILTAKEKICVTGDTQCNPVSCPRALGHYDRVNDAVYAMLTERVNYTREVILEYAERFNVCPFEMALDASLFCDCIIGDYNYAFDPRAKLKRYFSGDHGGEFVFLIDEAHNLVDRAREMFSATLVKERFLEIKRLTADRLTTISKRAEKCNKEMLILKRECENALINPDIGPLTNAVLRLYADIEKVVFDHGNDKGKEKIPTDLRDELLKFTFELFDYLDTYERVDENYTIYATHDFDGNFILKLFCVNPRKNLTECMSQARSSILFSATLLPIQYYKELLAGEEDDYEVYAKSVFDPQKRGLFIANDVTSKYTRRNDDEYENIARYIWEIVTKRFGNYMVFMPSYSFLNKVVDAYQGLYGDKRETEILIQTTKMKEEEREEFLNHFELPNEEKSLIGFCVMGGIFAEGIDLKNDSLIGAIIVGTGLPQVCLEQDVIKDFFDSREENGFDYAYRFPGMNKVLQASGRVIRTEEDVGIVALLDERFNQNSYRKLFPREWNNFEVVSRDAIGAKIERFWDEWL